MSSEAAIKAKHFGAAANTQRQVAMEAETYKTVNNVTNEKNEKNVINEKNEKNEKNKSIIKKTMGHPCLNAILF
jgi:hypothetical protein